VPPVPRALSLLSLLSAAYWLPVCPAEPETRDSPPAPGSRRLSELGSEETPVWPRTSRGGHAPPRN